jgi:hypothetical protein
MAREEQLHIISKMPRLDNKERKPKDTRGKHQLVYKAKHARITLDLSPQTLKAKKA